MQSQQVPLHKENNIVKNLLGSLYGFDGKGQRKYGGLKTRLYSEFRIKTIQWDWDKFYAASSSADTVRKENLYQLHIDI